MKKIFGLFVIGLLAISAPTFAQSKVEKAGQGVKKGVKKGAHGVKKGATVAANKTAKGATTAKAKVTDKKSEDWTGPQGQTIYMDDSRYYWINGNGKRIFVSQSALRARQKN